MQMSKIIIAAVASAALCAPAIAQTAGDDRPDLNRDGKITKEEAVKLAEMRFQASDLNGDGVLTIEESVEGAAKRFEAQDANGDGEITRKELRAQFMAKR